MLVKLVIPISIALLAYFAHRTYWNRTNVISVKQLLPVYDYVVVGGGTAGGVVAARLTELDNVTVLVLEAGYDDLDFEYTQYVPMEQQLQLSDFEWNYQTVPQEKCCQGSINRKSKWPRGKGLGGCSSHNGGAHVRGSRFDYDYWDERMGGGSGWSFQDVLPYFKKMENAEGIRHWNGNKDMHGWDGPIVLWQPGQSELADALVEAAGNMGYPWHHDINAMGDEKEQDRFGYFPRAQRGGRRMGTAEAYLRPAIHQHPDRLHVLTHAHVTKILFDNSRSNSVPVASAVEFIHKGNKMIVKAGVEVIVCAGSINTPQLLMLSGIGPKEELDKHNIPVLVANDAVGRNLYDHPLVPVSATVKEDTNGLYDPVHTDDWLSYNWAKLQFHLFGTGPLSDSAIRHTGFFRSGLTDEPWPDLQHFLCIAAAATPPHVFSLNEKAGAALYPNNPEKPGRKRIGILTILLKPHNSGEIRLKSADPFDHPLIDPKYLHNDLDVNILAKGLNVSIRMITSPQMGRYDAQLAGTHAPGCEHLQLWSDEYLQCYARNMMVTVYHPVGTCRMGMEGQNSVVDKKLRVQGVDRLRIIDASIFPFQVSANTNAPTIMVAEKGADLVKADYSAMKRANSKDHK